MLFKNKLIENKSSVDLKDFHPLFFPKKGLYYEIYPLFFFDFKSCQCNVI